MRRDIPTIVVEIVSEGARDRKRDYEAKRAEYIEAGVAEYWIIDRFQRSMTVVRAAGDPTQPPHEHAVGEQETYHTDSLPGFELPLALLFSEVDRLDQAQQ